MYKPTNEEFSNIQICVIPFQNQKYELWIMQNDKINHCFHLISEDNTDEFVIDIIDSKCITEGNRDNISFGLLNFVLKIEIQNSTIYQKIITFWNMVNPNNKIHMQDQPDYTKLI